MTAQPFSHVRDWIFDLDNTLYPPEMRLFDQIEVRMTSWVMEALNVSREKADHLRDAYWREYGTTLAGLMAVHDVDPGPYLTHVHDISLSHLVPDPDLAAYISDLPGRKFIFTNGTADYATKVAAARGLDGVFDGVFGVEETAFEPKPSALAFERIVQHAGIQADQAAMFEDDARNLEAPHTMGMRTVHVAPTPSDAHYVHHHTTDLTGFLGTLADARGAS